MKCLGRSDRGQIPVSLVGKNDPVRQGPLDACRYGASPTVGRLQHVNVKIIISNDGASRRRNADGPSPDIQFFDDLGDEPVRNAVTAAGTVMEGIILQELRFAENFFHDGTGVLMDVFMASLHVVQSPWSIRRGSE